MSFEDLPTEKQNTILSAACEVFAKHGYKKASIADIAAVAGTSKSVLFKYFSTKNNLYEKIFMLVSQSIKEADNVALEQSSAHTDLFELMRQSAHARLAMFKAYPWIYQFSYTAFFDDDPFVQQLVERESKLSLDNSKKGQARSDLAAGNDIYYEGLRKDISTDDARQLIRWVSMGYLEERLRRGDIDPEELEKDYTHWINIFETLLRDSSQVGQSLRQKEGDE